MCGASRGLGLEFVNQLISKNIQVVVMLRKNDNPQLLSLPIQIEQGDALKPNEIQSTLEKHRDIDAVISTMGSTGDGQTVDYIGHRNLIDSLTAHPCQRILIVTSLGCGDSWHWLSKKAQRGFGSSVREKSLAETWLQTSMLDYTIVRPGGLKNGPVTNTAILSQNREVHGWITRSELARIAVPLLTQKSAIKQIYACVDPNIKLAE